MKKSDLRPQEPKQPKKIEVKTALPWTIIIVMFALTAGFISGWMYRSAQVVTHEEIRAEVLSQIQTAKK